MQYKYPEIFYALLLLLIPIFIHLFQLRRFEKVYFTNVAFLKKVELQTRKSSKLKKILILLSRLGIFITLIFAFTQPFVSSNKEQLIPKTILYIDNSLSMQAKKGTDELFNTVIQEVILNYKNTPNLSILTNDDYYENLNGKDLKNQLLSLVYTPFSKELNTVILQTNKHSKVAKGYKNHVVLISDFQRKNITKDIPFSNDVAYSLVQMTPQNKANISIDSVYIAKINGEKLKINITLKSYHYKTDNIAVSLFNEDILVGKTTCSLAENQTNIVSFDIPFKETFNGKVIIDDNAIRFDNELFFCLNKQERINVLAIGNENDFLSRIYTNGEFNFKNNQLNQVDYNSISQQNVIVLNELETIPLSLQTLLKEFVMNGGSLVVIPANKTDIKNYNLLFSSLKIGNISKKNNETHEINSINFSHPTLDNVFEKQVKNFQYPNVKSSYSTFFKQASSILQFNNKKSFISQVKVGNGAVFWIASSINQKNSNFKNSPLIVPVFYNIGKQSFHIAQFYYTIGSNQKIDIKTKLSNDEVLHVKSIDNSIDFIPMQTVIQQKVALQFSENSIKSGFYTIKKKEQAIKNIGFNYNRAESETNYASVKEIGEKYSISYSNSIKDTFEINNLQYKEISYWKWFILLALLFLIIEIVLIKFLKN